MVLEQLFKFGSNFRDLGATNHFYPFRKSSPSIPVHEKNSAKHFRLAES